MKNGNLSAVQGAAKILKLIRNDREDAERNNGRSKLRVLGRSNVL